MPSIFDNGGYIGASADYGQYSIISDSLILGVDAGDKASYPGTGTTWTDTSGNSNNMTLVGSPTYSTNNGGVLQFDGSTQYATNENTDLSIANNLFADSGGSWSVTAWFKFPTSPAGTKTGNQSWAIVGRGGGIATGATFAIFVGSASDTTYGAYAPYKCACVVRGAITVISSSSVNDNTWHSVTVVWNSVTGDVFFDGTLTGALNNSVLATEQTYATTVGATVPTSSVHRFEGDISNAKIYNKALTPIEVQQNYNALKGRFGL